MALKKPNEAQVVARAQEFMAAREMSITRAAELFDVGASTLSELLTGNYKGSGAVALGKIERRLDYEERRTFTPTETEVQKTKEFNAVQIACRYAQERATGAIILGEAGRGKTISLKHYCETAPNAYYVECDQSMRGRGRLVRAISIAIKNRRVWRSAQMFDEICEALKGQDALLVFDDAQLLSILSINTIQKIHDRAGCGFVLAGVPLLHSSMARGRDADWFAQILSRCAIKRDLGARALRREDVLAVARACADGKTFEAGAENLVVEEGRLPGALRRVRQVVQLAGTFAADGRIGVEDVRKALEFRGL